MRGQNIRRLEPNHVTGFFLYLLKVSKRDLWHKIGYPMNDFVANVELHLIRKNHHKVLQLPKF